ncbi:MAG TPA: hypothetical protein VL443_19965 [Cyclobacteriaceae bacterium]|jgi:hypothetical protein|nr:hypothetical protein [Cyclobacteriaceae bacterium]
MENPTESSFNINALTNEHYGLLIKRAVELYQEVGMDIENITYKKNPIVESFEYVKASVNKPQEFEAEMFHFHAKLLKDLFEIRKHSEKDFKNYVEKIWQPNIGIGLYGEKFEIHTYAQLIKLNYPFIKQKDGDGPDFRLTFNNEHIFIECGTAQFVDGTVPDFIRKLEAVFAEKNSKSYVDHNVALWINVSDMSYHYTIENGNIIDSLLREFAEDKIPILRYGCLFFYYPAISLLSSRGKGCVVYEKSDKIAIGLESFMTNLRRSVDVHEDFLLLRKP